MAPLPLAVGPQHYGSLTTGLALRETSTAIDATVFSGSPGTGSVNPHGLGEKTRDTGEFLLTHDGQPLTNIGGHSGYYVKDDLMSASEYSTAAVIAGQPDLAITK